MLTDFSNNEGVGKEISDKNDMGPEIVFDIFWKGWYEDKNANLIFFTRHLETLGTGGMWSMLTDFSNDEKEICAKK